MILWSPGKVSLEFVFLVILENTCESGRNIRNYFDELFITIGNFSENQNTLDACRFWPIFDCFNTARFYLNTFISKYKALELNLKNSQYTF